MYRTDSSAKFIGVLASALFALSAGGIFWAITSTEKTVGSVFAYVAGLVIALTPCCLPLFFVITSLSIKQRRHRDALLVSTFFGTGIALIAAVLGIVLALTSQLIGLPQVSGVIFAVGGTVGYSYAISELFGFHLPILGLRMPHFNKNKSSYATAFSTGLLLGMGDIGCPNPFRYVLLSFIATSGNLVTGASLGFLYGLGAITPLILVALLAVLGINFSKVIVERTEKIERGINIAFVPIGSFLMTFGVFGDSWYESTIIHDVWESILLQFGLVTPHGHEETGLISLGGNMALILLTLVPLVVRTVRNSRHRIFRPVMNQETRAQ